MQEGIDSGELVELVLAPYPMTDWTVGVDLIWSAEDIHGAGSLWLRG
ncbi:hypothetical protein [Paenarthrobacter sp. YJN-5]|nr:hypothetical protein [Paenarthrobacter sp. YJN-5]QOT19957.1 hypothetical protein HMI59_25245 [Paenarthrobacter sp. YJN-5]